MEKIVHSSRTNVFGRKLCLSWHSYACPPPRHGMPFPTSLWPSAWLAGKVGWKPPQRLDSACAGWCFVTLLGHKRDLHPCRVISELCFEFYFKQIQGKFEGFDDEQNPNLLKSKTHCVLSREHFPESILIISFSFIFLPHSSSRQFCCISNIASVLQQKSIFNTIFQNHHLNAE